MSMSPSASALLVVQVAQACLCLLDRKERPVLQENRRVTSTDVVKNRKQRKKETGLHGSIYVHGVRRDKKTIIGGDTSALLDWSILGRVDQMVEIDLPSRCK
jgi:hypothetical protein